MSGIMLAAANQGGTDYVNYNYMRALFSDGMRVCPDLETSAGDFSWGWKASSLSQFRFGYEMVGLNLGKNSGVARFMGKQLADGHPGSGGANQQSGFEYIRPTPGSLSTDGNG